MVIGHGTGVLERSAADGILDKKEVYVLARQRLVKRTHALQSRSRGPEGGVIHRIANKL